LPNNIVKTGHLTEVRLQNLPAQSHTFLHFIVTFLFNDLHGFYPELISCG